MDISNELEKKNEIHAFLASLKRSEHVKSISIKVEWLFRSIVLCNGCYITENEVAVTCHPVI